MDRCQGEATSCWADSSDRSTWHRRGARVASQQSSILRAIVFSVWSVCFLGKRRRAFWNDSVDCCLSRQLDSRGRTRMLLTTILNYVEKHKGFTYAKCRLIAKDDPRIEVLVKPHARSRPTCDGCGQRGPVYDTQAQREFSFIPLWGIVVFLLYSPRRVDCKTCKRREARKGPLCICLASFAPLSENLLEKRGCIRKLAKITGGVQREVSKMKGQKRLHS